VREIGFARHRGKVIDDYDAMSGRWP